MTSGGGAKRPEGEGREGGNEPSGGGGTSRILGRAGRRYPGGAWLVAAPRWIGRGLQRRWHWVAGGLGELPRAGAERSGLGV